MTETQSLLSRLQSLTGPDREIDGEIALMNGWRHLPSGLWLSATCQGHADPPEYTTSIEAALTLVPDWANSHGYDFGPRSVEAYVSLNNVANGHRYVGGEHPTSPAIALLIAIMRAREGKDKT